MMGMKLPLVHGGRGAVGAEKKPLNERMTRIDAMKRGIYSAISASSSKWLSFGLKLWALNRLNALHVKYDSATGHK
jgi:hypothetical protein